MELSKEAREARNAYQREWRRNNPDKVKAQEARHWERVALQQMTANKKTRNADKVDQTNERR